MNNIFAKDLYNTHRDSLFIDSDHSNYFAVNFIDNLLKPLL
jgi:hypothetical protein